MDPALIFGHIVAATAAIATAVAIAYCLELEK
jgi:hypothetical protein